MTGQSIVLGAPRWFAVAATLAASSLLLVLWVYARTRAKPFVRIACAVLKILAFACLALALLEPLFVGSKPRRGANAFAIVVDNSQSLLVRDVGASETRGEWLRQKLEKGAKWRARVGQDFDVRNYVFDTHVRSVDAFETLAFDGTGSSIGSAVSALAKRFRGRPLAGVLLFTDGNRTDLGEVDFRSLPPIYPVAPPSRGGSRDVSVREVAVSQANFEAAPVVLQAEVSTVGYRGRSIVATLLDEFGKEIERQDTKQQSDGRPLNFRFQFRPEKKGVNFYSVRAFPADEERAVKEDASTSKSSEQTLANNSRLVVVDQGGGPYRVLYVGGRPNWEFKFLRRALADDDQIQLAGLIRLARRQPKFDFQNARDRSTNQLFTGFDNPDADTTEAADQSVLIRLDPIDEVELRDGFPKSAEALYRYHAIVVDDIEAAFFTPDQLALLRTFVSVRGGGLLMLGGPDAFVDGKYDRTPIGELLPVYLNGVAEPSESNAYRLKLTREGWLQPWVRTRKTEEEELKRLEAMPGFQILSRVGTIKPGAIALAEVLDDSGASAPALVAQSFGKGRVGALFDRRSLALGHAQGTLRRKRPRTLLEADGSLACHGRSQPGRNRRPSQNGIDDKSHGNRRPRSRP